MAEFKLICPGCVAEYMLPDDAIPPAGREVECSRCGHIWQARRPATAAPLDLGSYTVGSPPLDADDAPVPARRRLSANVLDILRDEVEHERRLRQAEGRDIPSDPEPQEPTAPAPDPDADWPATTVTTPGEDLPPIIGPTGARALAADTVGLAVIRHAPPTVPTDARRPPQALVAPPHTPAQRRRNGSYAAGFAVMVALAGCAVGLYLLAPLLARQGGAIGDQALEWRAAVDLARAWLDAQVARLIP